MGLDCINPTLHLLAVRISHFPWLLSARVETHRHIKEGDEADAPLVELQAHCSDLLQEPVTIVCLFHAQLALVCLDLGLYCLTALAPYNRVACG